MEWYEDEVQTLEWMMRSKPSTDPPVIFYGGSSIRLWETLEADFPGVGALNLGFGGATLAACVHFFHRLVTPRNPRALVVYAGDNDLGDGRSADDVFTSFRQIADLTRELPGNVGLTFLSIKPSPARWYLIDAIRHANQMIKTDIATRPSCVYVDIHTPMLRSDGQPRPELFADDGLHLSPEGYSLWKSILSEHADTIFSHKI